MHLLTKDYAIVLNLKRLYLFNTGKYTKSAALPSYGRYKFVYNYCIGKMEEAVALYYMSVNNYLLQLYNWKIIEHKNRRRKRRWWMTSIHKNRTITSVKNTFSEITAEAGIDFAGFLRISTSDFEILLQKLVPFIAKKDTKFRRAIPAKVRLAITLRYLASGDNFRSLHNLFKMSHQLISDIVHEVCAAFTIVLKDEIKMPANEEEWLQKEVEFHDIFPHCLGCIDGKQVISSTHSGTEVSNKPIFNIILMTLVDKNHSFMYADVGCQERIRGQDDFQNDLLFQKLDSNTFDIPAPSALPNSDNVVPYVFVADNAFPLHKNIMKPYSGDHLEGSIKINFNRQLSKARIVAENVFGVMSTVFRVLRKPITLQPDRTSKVVMSCILLHNFLKNSESSNNFYIPPGFVDTIINREVVPGLWRNEQQEYTALCPLATARENTLVPTQIRDQFAQHFSRY